MSSHSALMEGLANLNALLDRPTEGDDWLEALQAKNAALEGAVGEQIRALTTRLETSEAERRQADEQIREAIAGIMTAIGKVVEESRSINGRALTVLEGAGKGEDPALAREVATLKSAVQVLQEKLEAQPQKGERDAIEGQVDPVEEDAARAIERSVLGAIGDKMAAAIDERVSAAIGPEALTAALIKLHPDLFGNGAGGAGSVGSPLREQARGQYADSDAA